MSSNTDTSNSRGGASTMTPDNEVERQEALEPGQARLSAFLNGDDLRTAYAEWPNPEATFRGDLRAFLNRRTLPPQVGEKPVGVEAYDLLSEMAQQAGAPGRHPWSDRAATILATLSPPPRDAMREAAQRLVNKFPEYMPEDAPAADEVKALRDALNPEGSEEKAR